MNDISLALQAKRDEGLTDAAIAEWLRRFPGLEHASNSSVRRWRVGTAYPQHSYAEPLKLALALKDTAL